MTEKAPRLRASGIRGAEVIAVDQRQAAYEATVEIEDSVKPALVAEWLTRALM